MGKEKNKKEEEMKFGFDQISKEPPQWLKIISNYSIMILGALAIWSLSIPDKYATAEINPPKTNQIIFPIKFILLFMLNKDMQYKCATQQVFN